MRPPLPPQTPAPRSARPAPWRALALARLWQPARRTPRPLLWAALVGLLLVAQTLLVALTLRYEETRAQERSDEVAAAALGEVRRRTQTVLQGAQGLQARAADPQAWAHDAQALMRGQREIGRIERRDLAAHIVEAAESPLREPLFGHWPRAEMNLETEVACDAARRVMSPVFSRSQFVPMAGGNGAEVIDACTPVQQAGRLVGFTVASIVLPVLLEEVRVAEVGRSHELSFVEADGTRLARSGSVRGGGVFIADRVVDLPGTTLQVRVDAVQRAPSLIPNLATALVLGLSIGLFVVVLLLVRDGRRRARAENLLAEALAFRKAMEDSLLTGLRARDRDGRIVYANPAFCAMVGYSSDELLQADEPPYWPPEQAALYRARQADRLAPGADPVSPQSGYETVFLRRNGERFPVMIYEAPLVTGTGKHSGWMSAVLDLSAQRRAEDLSRQQQERLQATARLASVGEMASLLSHELNQPLSAIASYATGSLNLVNEPSPELAHAVDGRSPALAGSLPRPGLPSPSADELVGLLRHALERIAEQAERAGRVIKSVHDFVRRRHRAHEVIAADVLIDSVLPLVRLQARKSGARVEVDVQQPAPRVKVDRTMVEQVLLNLARNGIQAMEEHTPLDQRVLTLRVRLLPAAPVAPVAHAAQATQAAPGSAVAVGTAVRWVVFSVVDAGPGIPAAVAQQLFTPFFTTKVEGMGLGLSLCRTVIEQHGGALDFVNLPARQRAVDVGDAAVDTSPAAGGTEFRFTLALSLPRGQVG